MSVQATARRYFQDWMRRRIPQAGEITLNQRRIFVFPSKAGFGYLALVMGLLLGGINYENNMLFTLAFLLLSLFVISILHTYSNLSGLTLKCGASQPSFVGDFAEFKVRLSRDGQRNYEGLQLQWSESDRVFASLTEGRHKRVSLFVPTQSRGMLKLGRLLVETYYPLGLIRAWTWLDFKAQCMVYPKPLASNMLKHTLTANPEGNKQVQEDGSDDFSGFKDYRPGDSLKQVAWKQVARGLPLMTRHYESPGDQRLWIDWHDFDGMDTETRLSHMCYLVLYADQRQLEYGMRLPGLVFEPQNLPLHKLQCLQALALYQLPREDVSP